ncbi:hypothetical protein HMI55_006209 [Coelomomyces lativittatus]|nr:hypothetical protein HMI55_006209 [Coelomomyces lativittatus]
MKVMAYGICINRLLQVNGSYFVGKSLERIFPPCLSLIYQNDIRTLIRFLLDNSDFFHYVYYLRSDNTLHPCAVMAQEEFDGRISLVMEDLKNKEGLIRINEICIVQDVNDAISYLFGYNEEEILGKNVSMIMPSDIAKEHDGYIKRYLESKEKKLLGISRTLTGKHKDDIMFQVALEVIEKNTDGERLFLARIRHSTVPSQKLDMELFRKLRGSMTQLDDTGTNFLKSGFPDEKNKSKLGIPKGQEQKLPLLNPSIIRTMKQTQSTTELQGSLNISGSATTNHNKSIKITVDSEKTTSNPITNSGDIPTNGALLTAVPHLNSNPYGGSNKSIAFKEKAISPTQKGELNTPQKSALKQAFIRSAPLMEEEFKTNLGDDSKKTDYMEEDEEKANKDLEEVRRRSITKFESERKSNDSVVIFNKLELLKKEKPMDLLTSKVKKDAKDTSDTTSSYSQSAASTGGPNGNARDMKLIMLWKNTKSNPLHVKFQRRQIHAGILVTSALTLLSIISYLLYYQGIDSYEASFYTGFSQINRIYASIGRFAICRSRPTMSFCTAVPIQDWDTEWNGFSSNYTSTLEKMYTAYLQNYASLQNILPLDIYVFTHPNESISEKAESNFWALNKDIISSVSTLAIKTVAPQRQLNFLLGNKKVVLQEYQRLLLSIRASEQRDLETSTIYHNIAIGCTIFTVVAYKVYDPESEFDDSESLGADENFEVRDLTIERSVQEESVVEKRLQEGKSFMSKKKTNSIDKLPNEKKEVVQTDIFTSILIVCLYLSTIVTPITLMLLNDFYYVPETYRFLAMLSDFVSIFCKVVPLTHQIMDSSLNLMTSEARTELLASLSTLKIEIGAFQLEMGLHSLDNTVQSMLTSQTCFREGGCENVQALEGTNDGLAFILYVITEKMTLFLNIQEPYDPILLAELQTYLSQLTWFYLQYAMSTFSQGLIHSFNLFCQTSLSVALDLHIISILVAGIAFLFMHIIQRNMREDIKQNCLRTFVTPLSLYLFYN